MTGPDGITAVEKRKRIKDELRAAGMTPMALHKFNSRYLPKILHAAEHVEAVAYGRHRERKGVLARVDTMFVATDRRIIILNHKPGYTDLHEFAYDVVSGIEKTKAGPYTAVSLFTKLGRFDLRYVRRSCADRFCEVIEKRRAIAIGAAIQ